MADTNNNAPIYGENVRVFIGEKVIALSNSCELNVRKNLEDARTKDNLRGWPHQEISGRDWDVSVDALYGVGTDNGGVVGGEALDMVLADALVTISFDVTSATGQNRTRDAQNTYRYSGSAHASEFRGTAQVGNKTTYNIRFTGDGALVKGL